MSLSPTHLLPVHNKIRGVFSCTTSPASETARSSSPVAAAMGMCALQPFTGHIYIRTVLQMGCAAFFQHLTDVLSGRDMLYHPGSLLLCGRASQSRAVIVCPTCLHVCRRRYAVSISNNSDSALPAAAHWLLILLIMGCCRHGCAGGALLT